MGGKSEFDGGPTTWDVAASGADSVLVEWAIELADRLRDGEVVDLEVFARRDPTRAEELRRLFPAMVLLAGRIGSGLGATDPGFGPGEEPVRLDDFQIVREIGRGGMGIVYEARQLSLNRRVALKVLPAYSARDPRLLQRFKLEAQAIACLNHPNVVPIFSVGTDRGLHYFSMGLVEGRSLAQVIRSLRQAEGTEDFPILIPGFEGGPSSTPSARGVTFYRTASRLGMQAASALAHAHQQGVFHRDIKPANLLLDARGDLWVTDFGLARLQGDVDFTQTGDVIGTLCYMSPEQARGDRASVDVRTDIYSLGATLYELVTLRPAFRGDDRQEVIGRILAGEARAPRRVRPTIPADLETVILKAMATDPADRYATANELADDLRRFLENRPIRARRPSPLDRVAKWGRRHRAAVSAGGMATVLVLAALAAAGWWTSAWLSRNNAALLAVVSRADRLAAESRRNLKKAEEHAWIAERRLYASQVRQAQEALEAGDIERSQELLADLVPGPGRRDPRGFAWHHLWRLAGRDFNILRGHDAPVYALALAPDGRTLASGDRKGVVSLWDLVTRTRLGSRLVAPRQIVRLAFSPDGASLVVLDRNDGSNEGTLGLWDLDRGSNPTVGDKTVLLTSRWQLAGVRSVVCRPDDGHLITADADGRVSVRSPVKGREVEPLPGHVPNVLVLALNFDGTKLAAATLGHGLWIWDLKQRGLPTALPKLQDEEHGLVNLVFSPGGGEIASVSHPSHQVTVRRSDTGLALFPASADNHLQGFRGLAFSPDGQALALGGMTLESRLIDPDTGTPASMLRARTGTVWDLAFTPDGRALALACEDATVRLWRLKPRPVAPQPAGHRGEAWALAFTPDGRILATGGDDHTVRLWDTSTGREVSTLRAHGSLVASLAVSQDGLLLVSGCFDKKVRLWDLPSGRLRVALTGHTGEIRGVAISPDGRTVASTGSDRTVQIWDVASGRSKIVLDGQGSRPCALAFSPDGRQLACGGNDRRVRFFDTTRFRIAMTLEVHDEVASVAYSPDGASVVAADRGGVVTVWDSRTGNTLAVLKGPSAQARGVTFSPDGSVLAVAYQDRAIRLWDLIARQVILVLKGHGHWVNGVAFAPDGNTLASVAHDGGVKLWPGPGEED